MVFRSSLKQVVLIFLLMLFSNDFLAQNQTVNKLVFTHLETTRADFQLTKADIADVIITNQHTSKRSGITHTYLRQRHNGIDIYGANANVSIDKNGKIISYGNSFIGHLNKAITSKTPHFNAQKAIYHAAEALNLTIDATQLKIIETPNSKAGKIVFSKGGISKQEIPVKPIYQPTQKGEIRLAWDLSIQLLDTDDWWSMRIDAQTGAVLSKNNRTVTCSFNHKQLDNCELQEHQHQHSKKIRQLKKKGTFTKAKNIIATPKQAVNRRPLPKAKTANSKTMLAATYEVYPVPVESPNHGSRTTVIEPWNDAPNASPFGWHDDDGIVGADYTTTKGNNALTYYVNNGTGTPIDGGAALNFSFPIDLCNPPSSYKEASITNVFYWTNILHDVLYQYGFDEVSGNFQENNYGNASFGESDFVYVHVQYSSYVDAATFSSVPDGSPPSMTLHLWTGGAPPTFSVNSPANIANNYTVQAASFGPVSGTYTGNLVKAHDGSSFPTEACNPLINGAVINGNIALVDRVNCYFPDQVLNCQNAGAIAVLVCNFEPDNGTIGMYGLSTGISIPAVMMGKTDCAIIRSQIPTVNVTLSFPNCSVYTDSGLDNGIIAHEYGHGLSSRLVGGANTVDCLDNSEQQGEGWSDWLSLLMTMKAGDMGTNGRGIATYAKGQAITGGGLRTYPYSTDMSINPHTYNDIASEIIPHGVGSVWCAMLWEMTWNLIDEYGWDPDLYNGTGGNNIAMALVVESLKLQPCNAGFVEARDAILAADQALYAGANECLIWDAFAKRGLGYSAVQGDADNNNDQTEAFDTPCCTPTLWYADTDNDNYGDPNNTLSDCAQPIGYIIDNTDCNDNNPNINPSVPEICNGVDDNCDTNTDENNICNIINFKLFLEGNYAGANNMTNTLNANGLLPNTQPYNTAPWNYTGTETVSDWQTIPNAIDWILIEARDATNNFTVVETQAAIVLDNGEVVATDGNTDLTFNTLTAGNSYYFAIRHRNHLDIMSSNATVTPATIDFTTMANVMSGLGQVINLGNDVYGMYAGDVNADGIINVQDYNQYLDDLNNLPTINQYYPSDCNLDSTLGTNDFNTYQPNASKIGIHQIRY